MNFIGIDPGKSGGIAVIRSEHEVVTTKLDGVTERDVWLWLAQYEPGVAFIEAVHSSPQMGVKSAFTFGQSLGFLRGVLVASGIRFEAVSPQRWQKAMGCLSQGDKNRTKAKAQELFPWLKVTHATADALLLAEYAKRKHLSAPA